jgi:hypothetical protein
MANIERTAELCLEPGGLQPCTNCGSTAAIVEIGRGVSVRVRRLCCSAGPWWLDKGGQAFFALHGVNVPAEAEARRHG